MRIPAAFAAAGLLALGAVAAPARAGQLDPDDLAHKKDGGYVTGLPLAAYSTDIGLGLGARVYYYWDGHPDDPRFGETPYLYRLFLQVFASTGGIQFHWLDFDAPKIFDSPYRIRSQLIYARDTESNYFGHGERALAPLAFPGSQRTYDAYADYARDQQRIDAAGQTYARYDQYDLVRPVWIASIERLFDHDRVRVLAGFGLSYGSVHDYTGKRVDAVDASGASTQAVEAPTRLAEDCAAHRLVGCNGGRDDYLRLGISYDTRDYEPDPNTGVFLDLALDAGTVALGSQFDYLRAMAAARGYWSPIPERADLVVAGRVVIDAQTNGAPFFAMDTLSFTEDPRTGLGGHRTIRGFRQDRFVGSVMTVANAELRWTFGHLTAWGQRFGFIAAPFVDAGRPYDSLDQLSLRNWRPSFGGALRIAWNLATLATIDYGISSEDTGFYVNFNHIF
ncbi:MAG TPA: BamA/TamA family outer membrane protein [Kofleriaceae bacterium]|nr:BamA/TamA family outer membrane protein [Kofleriaceae bacterium]